MTGGARASEQDASTSGSTSAPKQQSLEVVLAPHAREPTWVRWALLALMCTVTAPHYFWNDVPAALHDRIKLGLEISDTQFGMLYSTTSMLSFVMGLPIGLLSDTLQWTTVVLITSATVLLSGVMMSLAIMSPNLVLAYYVVLLSRALFGFAWIWSLSASLSMQRPPFARPRSLVRLVGWLVVVGFHMGISYWFRGRELAFAIGTLISCERIVRRTYGQLRGLAWRRIDQSGAVCVCGGVAASQGNLVVLFGLDWIAVRTSWSSAILIGTQCRRANQRAKAASISLTHSLECARVCDRAASTLLLLSFIAAIGAFLIHRRYAAVRMAYCPELEASYRQQPQEELRDVEQQLPVQVELEQPASRQGLDRVVVAHVEPASAEANIAKPASRGRAYVERVWAYTTGFPAVLWLCCVIAALYYASEFPFKSIAAYAAYLLPIRSRRRIFANLDSEPC